MRNLNPLDSVHFFDSLESTQKRVLRTNQVSSMVAPVFQVRRQAWGHTIRDGIEGEASGRQNRHAGGRPPIGRTDFVEQWLGIQREDAQPALSAPECPGAPPEYAPPPVAGKHAPCLLQEQCAGGGAGGAGGLWRLAGEAIWGQGADTYALQGTPTRPMRHGTLRGPAPSR